MEVQQTERSVSGRPLNKIHRPLIFLQASVGFLIKNLVTTLDLREVARTDVNPHGLLIGNYEVLKNNRLRFVEREQK